jgi:sugar phosphate isomerase/epimerase
MLQSRRQFLKSSPAAMAVTTVGARDGLDDAKAVTPLASSGTPRIRIGVSTYSYWHFTKEKFPVEKVVEEAARLGFDGVEILHRQMADESKSYIHKLKRLAFTNGLDLIMLSIHQDFVSPDAAERQKNIDHTKHCINLASQFGIPCIRLNTGRWNTIKSFDELMAAGGTEPPLPGHTNEDAFKWCIDSIEKCIPAAEEAGVVMALENHWGLSTRPEDLLRIYQAVKSPWLRINMDTGNFARNYGDVYSQIERLAPHATIVQAKTYHGGGVWYTLDLDYKRIAGILRNAGFRGYVSLEMEGKEPAETAVPKSLTTLREAFS